MHLDVTGTDHQPFVIGIIEQCLQQLLPSLPVPSAAKPTMDIVPAAMVWWQIPSGSTGTQNPEYWIDEQTVITGAPP